LKTHISLPPLEFQDAIVLMMNGLDQLEMYREATSEALGQLLAAVIDERVPPATLQR